MLIMMVTVQDGDGDEMGENILNFITFLHALPPFTQVRACRLLLKTLPCPLQLIHIDWFLHCFIRRFEKLQRSKKRSVPLHLRF